MYLLPGNIHNFGNTFHIQVFFFNMFYPNHPFLQELPYEDIATMLDDPRIRKTQRS